MPHAPIAMSFTPRRNLKRARRLRRDDTPAEQRLWSALRDRRLGGYKFVRQEAIGPYIADFLCREPRLIVEVDGATHSDARALANDERRSSVLQAEGYRVLRIQNDDVYKHLPETLELILKSLERKL